MAEKICINVWKVPKEMNVGKEIWSEELTKILCDINGLNPDERKPLIKMIKEQYEKPDTVNFKSLYEEAVKLGITNAEKLFFINDPDFAYYGEAGGKDISELTCTEVRSLRLLDGKVHPFGLEDFVINAFMYYFHNTLIIHGPDSAVAFIQRINPWRYPVGEKRKFTVDQYLDHVVSAFADSYSLSDSEKTILRIAVFDIKNEKASEITGEHYANWLDFRMESLEESALIDISNVSIVRIEEIKAEDEIVEDVEYEASAMISFAGLYNKISQYMEDDGYEARLYRDDMEKLLIKLSPFTHEDNIMGKYLSSEGLPVNCFYSQQGFQRMQINRYPYLKVPKEFNDFMRRILPGHTYVEKIKIWL